MTLTCPFTPPPPSTHTHATSCHPFRYGRFMFMHNGNVGAFSIIRRRLIVGLKAEAFDFAASRVRVSLPPSRAALLVCPGRPLPAHTHCHRLAGRVGLGLLFCSVSQSAGSLRRAARSRRDAQEARKRRRHSKQGPAADGLGGCEEIMPCCGCVPTPLSPLLT